MYPNAALLISTVGAGRRLPPVREISIEIPTIGLQFSVHESTAEPTFECKISVPAGRTRIGRRSLWSSKGLKPSSVGAEGGPGCRHDWIQREWGSTHERIRPYVRGRVDVRHDLRAGASADASSDLRPARIEAASLALHASRIAGDVREIILDTETTGLDRKVDRIVEIGCVEIVDLMPTGRTYHQYVNPLRPVHKEAYRGPRAQRRLPVDQADVQADPQHAS